MPNDVDLLRPPVPVGARRPATVLLVLVVLFIGVVAVGLIAPPSGGAASASDSRFRFVEKVFPPRQLTVKAIRRGGPTCLQGATLVVRRGSGCSFIVPRGVHVVVFRRVPDSPGMNVTLSRTSDLTQNLNTGRPGPDPRHPFTLRFATVHDGATVTLSGCAGPASCRLDVVG